MHDTATPLVGGVAVYLAILTVTALLPISGLLQNPFYFTLLAGGSVLLLTGMVDDLRQVSTTMRFLVQIAACLAMIHFTGVTLHDFGELFSSSVLKLGLLSVPLTVFAALGVVNALNMIDGMDGLSAVIFIVAASGMTAFSVLNGDLEMAWFLLICVSAVLGFLCLNARLPWNHKARVFLGDAGTLMLGFTLAWCFIRLGNGADRAFMPMTAVWLFAVPLLDTATLIWRRWRDGRPVLSADQYHLHHAFLRAGFSVGQAGLTILLLALLMSGIGILFEVSELPGYLSFYTFMLLAFIYYFYMKHSWQSQQFLGRHFIHHDFIIEDGYA